jgi:zinc protease
METGRLNITEYEKGAMRMLAARTDAHDMVVIEGSVLGGYAMLPPDMAMVPRVATALFDAGTKRKSKETIRSLLSSRGASLSFSSGADRTYFSASCLPEDIELVLELATECLKDAIFPPSEIVLQKRRTLAQLDDTKTRTAAIAGAEFFRLAYDPSHINYADTLEQSIGQTERITRKQLLGFQRLLGKGGLSLAVTGDIRPDRVLRTAERIFNALPAGTGEMPVKRPNAKKPIAAVSEIHIKDKTNIDVFIGASVPITYDSPEFVPFKLMTSMLGGYGFTTAHLLRTIRDRDGFTYGIFAHPVGFGGLADGAIRIKASFSPAVYKKALEATKREVRVFLENGMTNEALSIKKSELIGNYTVGLATSSGLASALHTIAIEGKPLSYVDEYPSLINAVTTDDLKKAAALVPWGALVVSAAGTFEKKR